MKKSVKTALWEREKRRCQESTAYFYNNWWRIEGELPTRKITDEEVKTMIIMNYRRRGRNMTPIWAILNRITYLKKYYEK